MEARLQDIGNSHFTRRTPGQVGARFRNGSLLYKRARFYDPTTGEFTSRDPLEFVDGMSMMRGYMGINGYDPFGYQKLADPAGAKFGTTCAFHMFDYVEVVDKEGNKTGKKGHGSTNNLWIWEAGLAGDFVLDEPVGKLKQISDFVAAKDCCTIYVIGHRGGELTPPNWGGAASYPDPGPPLRVFPSKDNELENSLAQIFTSNCCEKCAINIVTCGGDDVAHRSVRQQIADRTGCVVCGSAKSCRVGGFDKKGDNITLGPTDKVRDRWEPECAHPAELPDPPLRCRTCLPR